MEWVEEKGLELEEVAERHSRAPRQRRRWQRACVPPWEHDWYSTGTVWLFQETGNRETAGDRCLRRTNREGEQICLLERRIEIKLSKQKQTKNPDKPQN